ncbi:Dabb family protein [Algoriphagus limi]|uniref:Dabb family protein n=1 Tax=Algoriphagus limi TaxID=2975273 RepID=A0ABT2G8E0_9BACT|nr:Dabb family protein [Algoriphagus limi]MCS5490270.1 Dabb family protein [Algoriphagus limi]
MKKIFLILALASLFSCQNEKTEIVKEVEIEKTVESSPDSVLRHVVYFSFKDSSSQEDIQGVIDAFRNLQNEIPGIQSFEWGVNSSPEGINKGLTHAFTLTFYSAEDRDAYLPHPAHKAFGEVLGPHLKDVCVVDYWTRH